MNLLLAAALSALASALLLPSTPDQWPGSLPSYILLALAAPLLLFAGLRWHLRRKHD